MRRSRAATLWVVVILGLFFNGTASISAQAFFRIALGPPDGLYHTIGPTLLGRMNIPLMRVTTLDAAESLALLERDLVDFAIVSVQSLEAAVAESPHLTPAALPFRLIAQFTVDGEEDVAHALVAHRRLAYGTASNVVFDLVGTPGSPFSLEDWQMVAPPADGLPVPLHPGAAQAYEDIRLGRRLTPLLSSGIDVAFPQINLYIAMNMDDWSPERFNGIEATNSAIRAKATAMVEELSPIGGVWGEYVVSLDEGDLFSVTFDYAAFELMMAHPAHLVGSVTVDLRTGEVYSLSDLFTDEYVDVLSAIVKEQIEADEVLSLFGGYEGIQPDHDFYLTPDTLVLYFQTYAIAPYAYGIPEFAIPYEELESVIHDASPLIRLRSLEAGSGAVE